MLSRIGARILLACSLPALSLANGCKGSADQGSRPLPSPEPPASVTSAPLRDDTSAPAKKRVADDEAAGKSKRVGGDASAKASSTSAADAATSANAAEPAPAVPDVAAPATAPATAAPSNPTLAAPAAACLSRCQGAMQGCLSAPVDGGVPGFSNLELCKKAFGACQSACASP